MLAFYRRQTVHSDGIVASTSLDFHPAGAVPPHMANEIHTVRDSFCIWSRKSPATPAARHRSRATRRHDRTGTPLTYALTSQGRFTATELLLDGTELDVLHRLRLAAPVR